MARLLILGDAVPNNISDGLHLRVQHLCAELGRRHECFFVGPRADECDEKDEYGLFEGMFYLEPLPRRGRSLRRHIRLSDEHFLRKSFPEYFAYVNAELNRVVSDYQIDALLAFAPTLSAVGAHVNVPRVLDYADSDSLTIQRKINNRGQAMSLSDRSRARLQLVRQTGRERGLVGSYNLTTTISNADRLALLQSSGVSEDRVVIVPNGVSEEALAAGQDRMSHKRTLVFWGNLDFPPNWTAVRYFYDEVYLPYLADKGIVWNIVGRGGSEPLKTALRHPNVRFHGFIPDLFEFAASQGVMVNPMVEGSGLKNKVLEALAIGLPIASTSLGVEAITGGEPGKHYLVSDSPANFASQVIQLLDDEKLRGRLIASGRSLVEECYTWRTVGYDYSRHIDQVIDGDGYRLLRGTA